MRLSQVTGTPNGEKLEAFVDNSGNLTERRAPHQDTVSLDHAAQVVPHVRSDVKNQRPPWHVENP